MKESGMEEENFEGSPSYYSVLGVNTDSSDEEIRRAYRKLAMQWHPDKWAKRPSLLEKAKKKFQQIQEAYSVLSDRSKRMMYDSGLYDLCEEEDEGFADFLQEMVSLMDNVKKEGKIYSMDELQSMLGDMTKSFESSDWSSLTQQFTYDTTPWYSEPYVYNSLGVGHSEWHDAENLSGTYAAAPCSSGQNFGFMPVSPGNGWNQTFATFY